MNCPACGNEMVDAQATNFGAKYKYCRTCKMDLDEIRNGAQPPVHQRPYGTIKEIPQPAIASFGCDSHLGGGHYRKSHTSMTCACGQIYFDHTVDAWRDRGPRASSGSTPNPNCSYGCGNGMISSNCPVHNLRMNSSLSAPSGTLTHGLIDHTSLEHCRSMKWGYAAGSAQARVHFFWPNRIGCDCGEFDSRGANVLGGSPLTHTSNPPMGSACACPGCRTPGAKSPSPPTGVPAGIPKRQPCGYCGSGGHDAPSLAQCPNYIPPSSFTVQKTHLNKVTNYFKQAAASDEIFRALRFAEAYGAGPKKMSELIDIPVGKAKRALKEYEATFQTIYSYGKLEPRICADELTITFDTEADADRARKVIKELTEKWRKEEDRRMMKMFNAGFSKTKKSRRP